MGETETLAGDELGRLAEAAFTAAGLPAEDAKRVSRMLVEAEMMGLATHGIVRVPGYVDRIRMGGVNPRPRVEIERRAPSLALVAGDNGLGPAVAGRALAQAMEMAAETGIGYVGCRESNHFGAMAPYALEACGASLVMVAATNASTTMPPWGGKEARIGNNPLCVAAPVPGGPHFILDMAMSVAARGKIRLAEREGRPIPEGWAVDRQGQPTTDPAAALDGFLVPLGGHKGSGLSMAVDILAGVLAGARFLTQVSSWSDNPESPSGLGHFFLVIDPERLVGRDAFAEAMGRFRDTVHATPAADANQPVLLPGEREQARRAAAMADGVRVPADLVREIETLGRAGAGP